MGTTEERGEAAAVSGPAPEGTAAAGTGTAVPAIGRGNRSWLVLAAVLPGMFLNVFDFFAVNVATPTLHARLGAGPPALELIVGGYGLTFSLGLVTGGRLGDRYGRRRVFFLDMAAFTLASAVSGLAPTGGVLIAARLAQGAALVLAGVALFGLGQGLLIPPIIGVVLARVPAADSGAASGVLVTVQQMSGTIGLALVSLGFFAAVGSGHPAGYVTGFRVACACDIALALGTLALSRLLAPPAPA